MMGRAGRPQYDTTGIAIIMTEKDNVDKFRDLTNNCQDIQSHLMTSLTEHINSEISLSTIIDLESSLNWIKNTFMYVRMKNVLIF
jgi:ATP-dependent DNA helicase HFM1/MER3